MASGEMVTIATTALVPANPQVQQVSKVLRIGPEKLIARIKKDLPAVVEQQLYLQLAADFRLQPKSVAQLLREYLGSRELTINDLGFVTVGENMVFSRFSDVADFLQNVLNLVSKDLEIPVSMSNAAKLVIVYGDQAENVLDDLLANSERLKERFKLRRYSPQRVVSFGIAFLVEKVLPKLAAQGRLNPPTLSHYLESEGGTVMGFDQ